MSYSIRLFSINRTRCAALGALVLALSVCPLQAFAVRAVTDYPERSSAIDRSFIVEVPRGQARANDLQSVEIERGKTIILETAYTVSRLAVGDPEIADFVAIGGREIEIIAKSVGDTNLLMWGDGRLQSVIDIHVSTLQPRIVRELTRLLDNPDIRIDVAGGSVVLRGFVPTLTAYEQATLIANAYLTRAKAVVAGQDPIERPEVINLLEVGGSHQVMIEVVIAELSRNFRRAFGVNLAGKVTSSSTEAATFQTLLKNLATTPGLLVAPGSGLGSTSISDSVTLAGTFFSNDNLDLRLFLEAVESNSLGSILAEPTLVARSGQQAEFLVGGEVPVPVLQDFDAQGSQFDIKFKKFGVFVSFTPTVMAKDRIHLQISPEVSEPDFSIGVSLFGSSIPSFRTRRVTTGVELGDGESFVLAGLLREDMIGEAEVVPFLGQLPILGQLFRSRAFRKNQTELVLFVTPRLVNPIEPGTRIELPTDHYIEPTALEFYWDGRIEGRAPKEDGDAKKKSGAGNRTSQPEADDNLWKEGASGSIGSGVDEDAERGGFVGSFGYRLESPRPTGRTE